MKKAGILVCVAILATMLGAALGCGGGGENGGSSGMTPKQVADAYMRATVNLDVDTAWELMSEADRKNITKEQMQAEVEAADVASYDISYVLGEETIDGDEATVEVTITVTDKASGQSQEIPQELLNLVKENGEWKIYFGDNL